jgi:DnaJ-class molecular chaperone
MTDIKVKCTIACPDCSGEGRDAEGQPCWTCHNRKRVTREISLDELAGRLRQIERNNEMNA